MKHRISTEPHVGACNKFFWAASCWSRLSFALPCKGIYSCWVIDPLKAWPFLVNVKNAAAMQDKQVNRFWDSFLGLSNVWNTSLGLLEILFLSMPELEFKAKTWREVHENVLKTHFLTWYVVPFYSTFCSCLLLWYDLALLDCKGPPNKRSLLYLGMFVANSRLGKKQFEVRKGK